MDWRLHAGRGSCAAALSKPLGGNGDVRVAMIGLGEFGGPASAARGRQLIDQLRKVPNVRIVALCDVDRQILGREAERFAAWREGVKRYADMRDVFDSPDIDAVFVATPNHWHALATIWACQAGKDVYVEKPASHSIWEGRQMAAAARKYKRIVQVGTQARSSDASRQAAEFLQTGQLGKILYGQVIVYRRREGIGKSAGPQKPPASVDYNLWLGPAPDAPPMRSVFHYDWHWFWDTGNGEIGNNGVHYLDRCRWLIGQNGLPRRAISLGGRFAFNDDGQTPNTQLALLDYAPAPIVCEVRGLPDRPGSRKMDTVRTLTTGLIVQCEGGYYLGSTATSAVYDGNDRRIKEFTDRLDSDEQASAHPANFIGPVPQPGFQPPQLRGSRGHRSAHFATLANVCHLERAATVGRRDRSGQVCSGQTPANVWRSPRGQRDRSDRRPQHSGPWVTISPDSEEFVGRSARRKQALCREYGSRLSCRKPS